MRKVEKKTVAEKANIIFKDDLSCNRGYILSRRLRWWRYGNVYDGEPLKELTEAEKQA